MLNRDNLSSTLLSTHQAEFFIDTLHSNLVSKNLKVEIAIKMCRKENKGN